MATTDIDLGVLARGPQGPKGEQGNPGPAPTLKIGTVTKLAPNQMPTANLSGGNGSYTLDLGIPQGGTNATGVFNGTISDVSTDFNNLVTEGHYDIRFSPNTQGKNGPNESDRGLLDVKIAGRMVIQTYYGDQKGNVYVRNRRDGSTWTAWRQVTFWS